ncbi:MAG TPA: GNAT family N-acetyltransferase [Luteimonas sp.]|nr:GNAT family N-acetyltransferase [Luteimonas sp.]
MDIHIRECDAADAPEVARLRADFLTELGHPLPADFVADVQAWLAQALGTPRVRVWAAEADGTFAGIVAVNPFERIPNGRNPAGRGWYVLNVYTLPHYRGRGIASRLLRAVNEAAAAAGVPALELRATDEGRPLYESFGFAASPHYMERMENLV